jgi:2-oxo-3-hexenedioate decarboxylase
MTAVDGGGKRMEDARIEAIASELLAVRGTGRQIESLTARYPELGLAEAYDVAARIVAKRSAGGEVPAGRKLGFTNPTVQAQYGISGPGWNRLFAGTVHELAAIGGSFALEGLPEPRIEPEIVLQLERAPRPGMDEDDLLDCVGWVAHAFEVVQSVFPGWRFSAAEATAALGVHGALLLGPRRDISGDRGGWRAMLESFEVTVELNGEQVAEGHGRNVLGGPLTALRFLVEELSRRPPAEALQAGEIVTTGTLTAAPPAVPGDRWSTRLSGIDLEGIAVRLR